MKKYLVFALFMALTVSGAYAGTTNLDSLTLSGSLTLGGEAKSSWGSVVSPMTDQSGYVTPTDAGSNLKLHDDGDITVGGGVATDVVTIWDGNAVDFHIGEDDSADQLVIGYGSTVGTTNMISLSNGRTVYMGDNTDNDMSFAFQNGDQDYHIGIDITGGQEEDLFVIGRSAAAGTTDDLSIGKASGTVYMNAIDAPGNVDFDIGSADVDDVTVVTDGGTLILDGTITLTDGEVISNATDDKVRIASNDAATIVEVYTPGTGNEDASLRLTADAGANAGDIFQIQHDGATNDLLFQSDTSVMGTPATVMTLSEAGIVTTTNFIDQVINDSTNTGTTDVAKFTHTTSNTAGTNVGVGTLFRLEDASGNTDTAGSIDVVYTTATHASEDADLVVSQMISGTERETLRLVGTSSATTAPYVKYSSTTGETNGVVDVMQLKLDSLGTPAASLGSGISIQVDDAGGVEEQVSIDVVMTDVTTTAEDADLVINQNTAGSMAETLRLVAASSATTSDYLQFTGNTSETNGVVDGLKLKVSTSGTAADNLGHGTSIFIEDDGGTVAEVASQDYVMNDITAATEDVDWKLNLVTGGTVSEALGVYSASSATVADYVQITSQTSETNASVDTLIVKLDVAGTPVAGIGQKIDFQIDDAGGVETQAELVTQLTTVTNGSEDCDVILYSNIAGSLTQVAKFDASNNGGLFYKPAIESSTTDDTLTAVESGLRVVFNPTLDSHDSVTYTLPTAVQGLEFTFSAASADTINVDPIATDIIKYLGCSVGDKIASSGATGDCVTLSCHTTGYWAVTGMGSIAWTDAN